MAVLSVFARKLRPRNADFYDLAAILKRLISLQRGQLLAADFPAVATHGTNNAPVDEFLNGYNPPELLLEFGVGLRVRGRGVGVAHIAVLAIGAQLAILPQLFTALDRGLGFLLGLAHQF